MDNGISRIGIVLLSLLALNTFSSFMGINTLENRFQNDLELEISSDKNASLKGLKITWNQLRDLTFKPKYNKEYRQLIPYPIFGESIKKLEGKRVSITGYMVPMDIKAGLYAVSRFNYSSCFFCGGAGEESVISLKFKSTPRRFKIDEYCTIEGTLELNADNLDDFIYIFQDAEEIK
ncbi:DUF3299 domain-containing protein [Jiulongibacter sp. NS-SX5]|uniref:DUF3299 domain-containing protein n=1 Tax=Jiulongibacter sp. NS-SX5 TaxID=3463854 RepID=UPI0040594312